MTAVDFSEREYPPEYELLGGKRGRYWIWRRDSSYIVSTVWIATIHIGGCHPVVSFLVGLTTILLTLMTPVPARRSVRLALFSVFALAGTVLAARYFWAQMWPMLILAPALVRLGHEGLIAPTRFGRFLRRPLLARSPISPEL